MELIPFSASEALIMAVNLAIILVFMAATGPVTGMLTGVRPKGGKASPDAIGLGIVGGGSALAIGIVMAAASQGEFGTSLIDDAGAVAGMGAMALVGITVNRLVVDHTIMRGISIREEVVDKGNAAMAMIAAGVAVATATIMASAIGESWGYLEVVGGFVASQAVVLVAGGYRAVLFGARNKGRRLAEEIRDGNLAVGIRFAGFVVATAVAAGSAGRIVGMDSAPSTVTGIAVWAGAALGVSVVMMIVAWLAEKVVHYGINVSEEVDAKRNIAVATTEAAVYVGIGTAIAGLVY